ncbi:MAG: class I SAM-dependent methyltransferase [Actinobacteria bacterium]|nr:class I SAM-dependent methyltransferase [Actinomycetota bacterium]
MNIKEKNQLAKALNIKKELIPFLPELLSDIWILGSWPDRIIELLKDLHLPENTQVIELGCGKGAVSIQVAKYLNYNVTGIDIFEPFLNEAKSKAVEYKVKHLCKFIKEDIAKFIDYNQTLFDVLIFAAVGTIGDNIQQTIYNLRKVVRPQGYIIIDDGFLSDDSPTTLKGYEYNCNYDETVKQLTYYGDKIIREIRISLKDLKDSNENNNICIKKRADKIIEKFPQMKHYIEVYIQNEKNECEFLETKTTPAIWLLQKQQI